VSGNALQAAASIFDALADVDARFAKGADKEYDTVSGEVKKWFKKLAVRFAFYGNDIIIYLTFSVLSERGEES
jgi:hypothetical protein